MVDGEMDFREKGESCRVRERERVKFENEERECILGLYIEP